jgi:YidC/Oxa1 family membrane protein insertase
VVLENKDIKVTFSTQGGKVKQVLLKHYKTYNDFAAHKENPLTIYDEAFDKLSFELATTKGNVDINKLFFTTQSKGGVVAEGQKQSVTFTLALANGQSIEQTYTLAGEGFLVDQNTQIKGLDGLLKSQTAKINWIEEVRPTEKDLNENRKATVNYLIAEGEEFDQLTETLQVPTMLQLKSH